MDMNPHEIDSGYPDSVNSPPLSRETDSDQRWDARDSARGFRFRLMCSYGSKIQQRSHDNQLSYVSTQILAVNRNIRFASMNAKLSSLWGTGVSFKYQLPNEDLDALVSVTNDEDMENMMAEYDRLQKIGYRFTRLRLFVFANKLYGSSQNSLGSLMEETKQENSFVDALNVGPVSRISETAPQGPWINNMPNYSFGLEGIGVKGDDKSAYRGYEADQTNSEKQELSMGRELQQREVQSAPTSPIIGYSSVDSIASAPARINTSAAPHVSDCRGAKQTEMGIILCRDFERESNLHANSKATDSSPVPEIGVLKTADRTANTNIQNQEHYTSEFSVVSNSLIKEWVPQQPQLQVPIQEFQKLQLRQPRDPIAWPVDDNANLNIPGRKIYSDPVRAVNLSNKDMNRPNSVDQAYMRQQQQIQKNPSLLEYYMHDQGSHFVSQSHCQMQEPHGDQQYHPVYFVHSGSPMMQKPMSPIRPMGQPVPGLGRYYKPVQRMTTPVQVYSPEAAPSTNPVTTARAGAAVQRETGSAPTVPYERPIHIPFPVPNGPYTSIPSEPVASDVRVVYRPTVPAPLAHTEPYSYQNVIYEPSAREIYYMQAPPASNPQYQLMNSDM